MASLESVCARLCLLSHVDRRIKTPLLSREAVGRMISTGALEGLVLRSVPDISEVYYERAKMLLAQSAHVYAKLERYQAQGYEVLLPDDVLWPDKLKKLGRQMPQFLFVKGDSSLFSLRSVAVAGSRKIAIETSQIAERCGKMIGDAGFAMVCGGANGVDAAAQRGLLEAGGSLILIPAIPARELLEKKDIQYAHERNQVLLCCDTWPDEAFSAHKALSRNHTIYAMGDAALVIAARDGKGGSWQGATDCLRGGYTPLYTISADYEDMKGNHALVELGAKRYDLNMPMMNQLFLPSI